MNKKIKRIIRKNSSFFTIVFLSLLAFIIGSFALGIVKSFIIVGIVDLVIIIATYFSLPTVHKRKHYKNESVKKHKISKKKKIAILKIVIIGIAFIGILIIVIMSLFFYSIVKNAPEFDPNKLYNQNSSIIYDKDGNEIARLGTQMRDNLKYEQIPEVLIDAIIATEESRFFVHNGVDLPRFLKASVQQLMGIDAGGASTLTMQINKNQFTSSVKSGLGGIKRKFTDVYMAVSKIEPNYSKEDILTFYVNAYYMGGSSYGVEQACLTYFGKHASEINLAEAAMIAGLFQAPTLYDPYINPEKTEKRRQTVLNLMERHGYITKEQKEVAKKMTVDKIVKEKTSITNNEYQGFIDTVVKEVYNDLKLDPYDTPIKIYTTLDKTKQDNLNKIMSGENFTWENDVVQAGVAILDTKTSAILAIGNGRNREGAKLLNFATDIKNQIGSTAKPLYDYGPGIEYENWSTYKMLVDEPYHYTNGPEINNWDSKWRGTMTMREALSNSWNVPALKAFQQNKNSNVLKFVTSLGLSPEVDSGKIHEAHAIGGYNGESPLTLANAYAAFANGGYYTKAYSYTKVVLEDETVYEKTTDRTQVMSPETAYMICDLLKTTAPIALGDAKLKNVVYGAKTGTTNYDDATKEYWHLSDNAIKDLWVTAISPDYTMALWYGYENNNSQYYTKSGNPYHRRLFNAIAKDIYTSTEDWVKPADVVEVEVESGNLEALLPSEYTPSDMRVKELFKAGTEPTEVSKRYSKLDNVKNLDYKLTNNKLTLTWDKIDTPDAINVDKIRSMYASVFTDGEYRDLEIQKRVVYNNNYIGTICYKIYEKDSQGNLKLLSTTADNKFEQTVYGGQNSITYVVKTSYTIFTANMSDGSEIKVSTKDVASVITSELKGDSTVNLNVGTAYDTNTNGVIVLENLTDVTSKATVTKVITDSNHVIISSIPSNKAGTYTITYTIKYKDYNNTLKRTIIYK